MWLTPYGHTLGDEQMTIHGGSGLSQWMTSGRHPWEDAINKLAPAIKEYMQQKRSDEIANQLMNMEAPPRAEAVDQYGATYDPTLAASQGLMSQTEPRATPAATGGQRAFQAQKMYQDYLNQQQDRQPDTATDDLNYQKLWNETHTDETSSDESGKEMTDYQKEQTRLREMDINRKANRPAGAAKTDPWTNAIPVARGRLATKDDVEAKRAVTVGDFTNQYSDAGNGDQMLLKLPSSKQIAVPYSAWEARQQQQQAPGASMYQERINGTSPASVFPPVVQSDAPDPIGTSPASVFPPDTSAPAPTAPAKPSERVAGSTYQTPKGVLRWTGTGWTAP